MKKACVVASETERDRAEKFCNELNETGKVKASLITIKLKKLNDQTFVFDFEQDSFDILSSADIIIPSNSGILKLMMYCTADNNDISFKITLHDLKTTILTITDDMIAENIMAALPFQRYQKMNIKLMDFLSKMINHEYVRYLFLDKAQAYYLRKLSLLKREVFYSPFSLWYKKTDYSDKEQDIDIAFCGSIGIAEVIKGYEPLFHKTFVDKLKNLERPLFEIFWENIQTYNYFYGKSIDQNDPLFWILYKEISWEFVNPLIRAYILGNINKKVKVFGFDQTSFHKFTALQNNSIRILLKLIELSPSTFEKGVLETELKGVYLVDYIEGIEFPTLDNIIPSGRIQFQKLNDIFSRTKINILISNMIVQSGIPTKLLECVSAGGFFLTDPRYEMKEIFGDDIEAVTYRNIQELNQKIEYFLHRPKERRDIVKGLQEKFFQYTRNRTPVELLAEIIEQI
ncbi:MAG: glycosyltransferase [Candidatus Calescibacterium sp.]|nr:glycosyltransferase [Candidatus Calescibacterium sp.]MDW8086569.1 glycosyltransferase [Candidatus Calescibacterium sp.]